MRANRNRSAAPKLRAAQGKQNGGRMRCHNSDFRHPISSHQSHRPRKYSGLAHLQRPYRAIPSRVSRRLRNLIAPDHPSTPPAGPRPHARQPAWTAPNPTKSQESHPQIPNPAASRAPLLSVRRLLHARPLIQIHKHQFPIVLLQKQPLQPKLVPLPPGIPAPRRPRFHPFYHPLEPHRPRMLLFGDPMPNPHPLADRHFRRRHIAASNSSPSSSYFADHPPHSLPPQRRLTLPPARVHIHLRPPPHRPPDQSSHFA